METGDPRAALAGLIDAGGESCAALSRMLGRNAAYVQQYLKRGSPRILPERDRGMLARYFGVSEALLGGPDGSAAMVGVAAPDVVATAGAGGMLADEDRGTRRLLDPALLRALGVRPDAASIIRVQGDSMAPTLQPGDEILVDTDRRAVPRGGGLFVLRQDGVLLAKRLLPGPDGMAVLSDNPAYPRTDPVAPDGLEIIGRVAWRAGVPA